MHQWTGSSLVQVMACRLFGAKPFPEPMLVYCWLDYWPQVSVKFESEFYHFHSRRYIWKCCLLNWRPFCPGGDELIYTHDRSFTYGVRPSAGTLLTSKCNPGQNDHHFTQDIFKCIFLNKDVLISIKISLKFIPNGPISNIPQLVQIMAWHWPGDKPLSEPMLTWFTKAYLQH